VKKHSLLPNFAFVVNCFSFFSLPSFFFAGHPSLLSALAFFLSFVLLFSTLRDVQLEMTRLCCCDHIMQEMSLKKRVFLFCLLPHHFSMVLSYAYCTTTYPTLSRLSGGWGDRERE
jgi:hypothetical protein